MDHVTAEEQHNGPRMRSFHEAAMFLQMRCIFSGDAWVWHLL